MLSSFPRHVWCLHCQRLEFTVSGGNMPHTEIGKWRAKAAGCAFAMSILGLGAFAQPASDPESALETATPIKHVIIIVGENRSFDHLFATYLPVSRNENVLNLLSEGIVNGDGSPGWNFAK